MSDDADVSHVDMLVGFDKVVSDDRSEQLGWRDGILFRQNVASLLLSIRSYNYRIVGFGVAGGDQFDVVGESDEFLRGLNVPFK